MANEQPISGLDAVPTNTDKTSETPTSAALGPYKMTHGAKGTLDTFQPSAGIVADEETNRVILNNMQKMLNEYNSPYKQFQDSIQKALAYTHYDPTVALGQVNAQEQMDRANRFNLAQQMASLEGSQRQLRNFEKLDQQGQTGATGATGGAGSVAAGMDPEARATYERIKALKGVVAAEDYRTGIMKKRDELLYGANLRAENMADQLVYDKATGNPVKVPFLETIRNPNKYSLTPVDKTQITGSTKLPVTTGGTNLGNMRPPGQSTGFQAPVSVDQDLARIDNNLKSYGDKGINTLSGVISRWAPPNENDTPTLIKNAAQFLGIDPNQKIDLSNPAVRQTISTAIIKQEGNLSKVFSMPSAVAATAPTTQAAVQAPLAPSGSREQDLLNMKQREEAAKAGIAARSKEAETAAGEAGKAQTQMNKLADAADLETIPAANAVLDIVENANRKHVAGYLHGGDKMATALYTAAKHLTNKTPAELEEEMITNRFKPKELEDHRTLNNAAQKLGIQFAADVFKGARMGIGLEKMAMGAKGIGAELPPEVNAKNARLIKDAGEFQKAKQKMWGEWSGANGGALASFDEFERSPEYVAFRDKAKEHFINTYRGIVKEETLSVADKAKAELEKRKAAKGNQ